MFELQIGQNFTLPSSLFDQGVFLTGRAGQGKSTTYIDVALQAVKHKQRGLILDPYGDLVNAIREKCVSKSSKEQIEFFDIDATKAAIGKALKAGKMVVVAADLLTDGERRTRVKMQKFFKSTYGLLKKGDWILMDEVFGFVNDEIFEMYLDFRKKGLSALFCDIGLSRLSAEERHRFCEAVPNFLVYKCMNYDAVCLTKEVSSLYGKPVIDPKKIAAINQYHYLALIGGDLSYVRGTWPIGEI